MGGALELRVKRMGLSASLLSTGGTLDAYDSSYTNLSLAVSYVLLQVEAGRLRGDFGAKLAGGFTSTDDILRGYVGAGLFAAADYSVTSTWHTRLETQVGHAGWSDEEPIRYAQGVYFGATLALGVGGNL